ncbi:TIM barrel protein [Arthrobacter sp. NPDC056691]|uniref:TIM barrel protein n=1 Tax=Arthrobacter sp. NPDC056691 TaxID=3345913 RepID=UPI00367086D7
MSNIISRLAAAPISWGLVEVEGWGYQLEPAVVLDAIKDLGFKATEFGPLGFLPTTPDERRDFLSGQGLHGIGGFFPVVLHDPETDPLLAIKPELQAYEASGATTLVLAAATGLPDYDFKPVLDETGWKVLCSNLEAVNELAAEHGITVVVHPHIGCMIETAADVDRIVADTTVAICLDTGHLHSAGADTLAFTEQHIGRIKHTHLKDVDRELGEQFSAGDFNFTEGVRRRMFVPLGDGAIPVREIITALVRNGYDGWFTLEQDTMLTGPEDAVKATADVKRSVEFLRELERELGQ